MVYSTSVPGGKVTGLYADMWRHEGREGRRRGSVAPSARQLLRACLSVVISCGSCRWIGVKVVLYQAWWDTQHEGGSSLGEAGALWTHWTFTSRAERSWKHPQVPGVRTQLRAGCAALSPLRHALSSGTSLPSRCSGTTRWVQCVSTWCLVCPRLGRVRCSTCFPSQKYGDAHGCQTLPVAEGRQCHSSPQQELFPALLAAKRFAFQ